MRTGPKPGGALDSCLKIRSVKPLLSAFFAGLVSVLATTGSAATNEGWSVRVWQSDSLSDRSPVGLAQTDDGFLWIATLSSLVRFDGFSFQEFTTQELVSQPDRRIRALARGHDDNLVLAFDFGLIARFHSGSVELFTNASATMVPETVLEDADQSLWLSYRDPAPDPVGIRHVCRIKDGKTKWFSDADGLPRGRYFLARDAGGQVWFARDGAIGIFRGDRFEIVTNLPTGISTRITGAVDGGVWLASGLELFRYDPAGGLRDCGPIPARNSGTRPTVLFADSRGALWIATANDGLFRYDAGSFESVPSSDRSVSAIMEDREGNLWAGTSSGMNRLQPQFIRLEGTIAGLPSESVRALCEDTSGVIWATTHDGLLAVRTNGGWQVVSSGMDIHGLFVTGVAADPSGGIWIGTRNRRLLHWHEGQLTTWGPEQGTPGRAVSALSVSRRGDVWVAWQNPEMLQCLRDGTLHTLSLPAGTIDINAIEEDAAGDVWFGVGRGALLCARQGGLQVENVPLPGEPKPLLCLHSAADGSLWIGFRSGGLGRLKDGRFTFIGPEQGFHGNRISQILSDNLGNLWFSSEQGLCRVAQTALETAATTRAGRVQPAIYASGPELSTLSRDAGGALRSRDGRLWIPMGMTLATIIPEKLPENTGPPQVLLKRVTVDGRDVAVYGGTIPVPNGLDPGKMSGPLRLDAGLRRLEFEFAALSFQAPENVHFRYRLEGFDEKWIETADQRSVAYSRLAAGRYRFHVTACNGDGVWNPTGAEIAISVAPFFWQRWWFQLGTIAVLIAGLVAAVRYVSFHRLRRKVRILERQAALDKERARIARDIHDDIGGNLTKILLLTELTLRDRGRPDKADKVPERVREISGTARQVMKSLDETVWAIDPQNDTLSDLITYLGQFAVNFLQNANISCQVDMPDRPLPRAVTADIRHDLFLATKEALHNVVRHARATEVTLRIAADEHGLTITIADNGCGFTGTPDQAGADGLRNMRQRMQEIGGDFRFQSVPGSGTTISLACPWRGRVDAPR